MGNSLIKFLMKFSNMMTLLFFFPASVIVLGIAFDTPISYIQALAVSIVIRFAAAMFNGIFFLRKLSENGLEEATEKMLKGIK